MSGIPKVCHLVIALNHGGLERLVVDWTNARNRRHPGTTLVGCLDEPGALAGEIEGGASFCVGAQRARWPWDGAAVRLLRHRLGGDAAILHSHNLAAQQYAALACRGTAMRQVHTEHGSNVHVGGLTNRLRHRWLARAADALVAVSQDTALKMAPAWGVAATAVRVIANGVVPHCPANAETITALRHGLDIPDGAIVIGTVGRLARVKGYDRLLAVLPAVLASVPQAICVLVGDGPERAALEAQTAALGIDGRVRFAGFRTDARDCYALFDLYVAPSRSEGLPVALLEAMAAGCPALVTDVGEQRAVLDGDRAGSLLAADEAAWPRQILDLLGGVGRETARQRAAVARQRVADMYGLDRTLDAYESLYAEVLARAS